MEEESAVGTKTQKKRRGCCSNRPLLTLSHAAFIRLLTASWCMHFLLLVVALVVVCAALQRSAALSAWARDFAGDVGVGASGPLLALPLGAGCAASAVLGLSHAAAASVRCYSAGRSRLRCMRIHVWLSTVLVALAVGVGAAQSPLATCVLDAFPGGVARAMATYNASGAARASLDRLQLGLRCCGATAYDDWFHLAWFPPAHGGAPPKDKGLVSDDVPFSCCQMSILKPCIHHGVLSASPVYRYDPLHDISVWTRGCVPALLDAVLTSAYKTSLLLVYLALIQAVCLVLARLVQTAALSAQALRAQNALPAVEEGSRQCGRALRRQLRRTLVHSWLLGSLTPEPPRPLPAPPPSDADSEDSLLDLEDSSDDVLDDETLPEKPDEYQLILT